MLWVSAAFAAAFLTAAITLASQGTGQAGTIVALRLTARLSLLLFWPAYAGGVLCSLHLPLLSGLGRRRREIGLAFASAHSVHVMLILWLFHVAVRQPVSTKTIIVDGIGIGWVYVLAAFSFDSLRRRLGPMALRILFNMGLEYIALVFLSDFLISPLKQGTAFSAAYLPFTVALVAAAALRWTLAGSDLVARTARI